MTAVPLLLTLARGALTGLAKRPSPDAALPPTRLTSAPLRIDPAHLAAYARICAYRREAEEIPLTYPHILGFPPAARLMAGRAFPLPLLGLVHTSITITAHTALTAADRLELAVYAAQLRPHPRGTEVVVTTTAHRDGELAWEDESTYLSRHPTPAGSPPRSAAPRKPPQDPPPRELPAVEEWRLPANLGRAHARVSGDYNPIHLSPLTARPLGYSRAIAHGMWTIARCAAKSPKATRVTATFRRPIPLPATVTYAAASPDFEVRSAAGIHLAGTAV